MKRSQPEKRALIDETLDSPMLDLSNPSEPSEHELSELLEKLTRQRLTYQAMLEDMLQNKPITTHKAIAPFASDHPNYTAIKEALIDCLQAIDIAMKKLNAKKHHLAINENRSNIQSPNPTAQLHLENKGAADPTICQLPPLFLMHADLSSER